jgi:signal transduction histidine kinase
MGSSKKAGVLRIKEEIVDDAFVLTISDNGKGVKPEDLEKIFEPFFSTKQDGLGLGLPMTRRVMEEHGGKVELHSVFGEGSEVRLTLPLPTPR